MQCRKESEKRRRRDGGGEGLGETVEGVVALVERDIVLCCVEWGEGELERRRLVRRGINKCADGKQKRSKKKEHFDHFC